MTRRFSTIPEPGSAEWENWLTVTSPLLPDLEELLPLLKDMLDRRWVTNQGPFVRQLETELRDRLDVGALALVTNGTSALELAIRSCVEEGEVLCTSFSFPATWNLLVDNPRYAPVFVDIGDDFNIDPAQVEAAITPRTRAVLAVHAYGYPCKHAELKRICDAHDLALLYDAAHCFGVRVGGRGIGRWGQFSTFSFHATKVFNTLEGGCVTAAEPDSLQEVELRRNFGFRPGETQQYFGQNAKMDEFRALFGLVTLRHMEQAQKVRAQVSATYLSLLSALQLDGLWLPKDVLGSTEIQHNHAYFPIRLESEGTQIRDRVFEELRSRGILARRYFSNLFNSSPLYADLNTWGSLPGTRKATQEILCLPIHHEMTEEDCVRVVRGIADCYGQEMRSE